MALPCPDETTEEELLCDYCDLHGWQHWHVPQETFTTSWKQKMKNKRQGVKAGVSDHWIVLPTNRGKHLLVAIELKRKRGNTPTNEQIEFLESLDRVDNVVPVCCYGADEAIEMLEELRKYQTTLLDLYNDRMMKLKSKRKIRENPQKSDKTPKNTPKSAKNDLPY